MVTLPIWCLSLEANASPGMGKVWRLHPAEDGGRGREAEAREQPQGNGDVGMSHSDYLIGCRSFWLISVLLSFLHILVTLGEEPCGQDAS